MILSLAFVGLVATAQTTVPPAPRITQNGDGTIKGIVSRPDNARPIPDVLITLVGSSISGNKLGQLNTITDASGAFAFENLPEGAYLVLAIFR